MPVDARQQQKCSHTSFILIPASYEGPSSSIYTHEQRVPEQRQEGLFVNLLKHIGCLFLPRHRQVKVGHSVPVVASRRKMKKEEGQGENKA